MHQGPSQAARARRAAALIPSGISMMRAGGTPCAACQVSKSLRSPGLAITILKVARGSSSQRAVWSQVSRQRGVAAGSLGETL